MEAYLKDKKKIVLIVLVMISLILVDQVIKGIIVQNFVDPVGIHLIKINLYGGIKNGI